MFFLHSNMETHHANILMDPYQMQAYANKDNRHSDRKKVSALHQRGHDSYTLLLPHPLSDGHEDV
jgi:hypothetical protein